MPRIVLLDANVVDQLSRGNRQVAQALQSLIKSNAEVYVSQQAYNELTGPGKMVSGVGPDIPRTATANRLLLSDLGIQVGKPGRLEQRVKVYDKNVRGPALSNEDMMVVAQARALKAEVWSYDKAFRKNPNNIQKPFGVKVAPESKLPLVHGTNPDYRVARKLMNLPPVNISVGGIVVRPPHKTKPPTGTSGGGQSGGPASGVKGKTEAIIGVPTKAPTGNFSPSARGAVKMQGAELGLRGINFLLQKINDAREAKKAEEEWARTKPRVEKRLAKNPSVGALVMIRFGRRKKQGAEHESPLEHLSLFFGISVTYGATESEALWLYHRQPRLGVGPEIEVSNQRFFVPPHQPVEVRKIRTPFSSYGVATFANGKSSLLRVEWKGVFGFDEISRGDLSLPVQADFVPRFLLLLPPSRILWSNGPHPHITEIPIDWKTAVSSEPHITKGVAIVDMDRGLFNIGDDTAAPVFPADNATRDLFAAGGKTKDNLGQLRAFVNFDKLRWVRPENIHVLQKFVEED